MDVRIRRFGQSCQQSLWISYTSKDTTITERFSFSSVISRCKPVITEPLFKMWKEADLETMRSRLGAMIKIWTKKQDI